MLQFLKLWLLSNFEYPVQVGISLKCGNFRTKICMQRNNAIHIQMWVSLQWNCQLLKRECPLSGIVMLSDKDDKRYGGLSHVLWRPDYPNFMNFYDQNQVAQLQTDIRRTSRSIVQCHNLAGNYTVQLQYWDLKYEITLLQTKIKQFHGHIDLFRPCNTLRSLTQNTVISMAFNCWTAYRLVPTILHTNPHSHRCHKLDSLKSQGSN